MSSVVIPSAWSVPSRCARNVVCGRPSGPLPGVVSRSCFTICAVAPALATNSIPTSQANPPTQLRFIVFSLTA
uniref:Uncharacterized protein n=1 Tax=mine drainage metagenome TaxID=410659 RepID=E6PY34_9ZZZZ